MSRVTMFVFNDVRHDNRVLREATSLGQSGHTVTVVALPLDGLPPGDDRDAREGFSILRVPVPPGGSVIGTLRRPWRLGAWAVERVRADLRRLPAGLIDIPWVLVVGLLALPLALVMLPFAVLARLRRRRSGGTDLGALVHWQLGVLGWARRAARTAPPSDVWHGHDLHGLAAAVEACRVHGGQVVYDSHEIYLESGSNVLRGRWYRSLLARSERRWTAEAAALITISDALAAELDRRLAPKRIVVVHNCPARWTPPAIRPDLIRGATGIPADAPIALYHGGFSLYRGVEQLAAALLEPGLERVHAVCLGYGGQRAAFVEMAAEPRFEGRFHVLDAVPPDELLPWVASADVGVIAAQPATLNHRLGTPNKLFECLAAGVPLVVSDFSEMRRIVLDDPAGPLGAVCAPHDVADVARAIRSILDLPAAEREALRARCLRAAHQRWNWETESAKLVALYAELSS